VAIYAQVSPAVVLILNGDSLGSGTLLSSDGLLITNWHVVRGAKDVGVIFKPAAEGQELTKAQVVRGKVVRVDQLTDLALVRTAFVPPQAKVAQLASGDTLQVGDDVHAIGHPTGEAWTYTRGIVSQIRRRYEWTTETKLQHVADVVQTQTPINPGNSGGPLLNNAGEIVGVNSFKGEGEGLNFAVAVDAVQAIMAATDDRIISPVRRTEQSSEATECKPRVIKRWRTTDPPGDAESMDIDCSGSADAVLEIPDDKSQPITMAIDSKHSGHGDTLIVDTNRDGYPDYALYDTTGSGKPDLIGYFHNHEFKPYRVERFTPRE
jgi:hypothetical protein